MSLNQRMILNILLDQVKEVDERYSGYREAILETLTDILMLERQDKVSHSNIQIKINDKCNAAGRLLADKS